MASEKNSSVKKENKILKFMFSFPFTPRLIGGTILRLAVTGTVKSGNFVMFFTQIIFFLKKLWSQPPLKTLENMSKIGA